MNLRHAPYLIALLGLAVVAWGLWNERTHPPHIVASSTIEVDNIHGATPGRLRLATRTLEIGTVRRQEIELPNGTWIDCAGDCHQTVRASLTAIWDEQLKRSR